MFINFNPKKIFIGRTIKYLLLLLAVLLYWPAFTTEFGMHNDYTLIPPTFANHEVFFESRHLVLIGRILEAGLMTLLSWCIDRISDFTVWRLITFVLSLLFIGLFVDFLYRRFNLERFWRYMIAAGLFFLPSSQLFVLWIGNFVTGFVTLILAFLSYFLLERGWPSESSDRMGKTGGRIFIVVAAAIVFLTALFIYPSNAMFVFVCTFAWVLFSPIDKWYVTRRVMMRDMLFYGSLMVVYFLLNVKLIIPRIVTPEPVSSAVTPNMFGGTYQMSVTSHLFSKWPLLIDTILISWAGTWHTVLGSAGGFIPLIIVVLSLGVILVVRKIHSLRESIIKVKFLKIFAMLLIGCGLFLLANLPEIMAKGCLSVIGYRVLFVPASFLLILQFGLLWHMERLCNRKGGIVFIRFVVVLSMLGASWVAAKNVSDTTRNYHRELEFVREKTSQAGRDITRVLFIVLPPDQGNTLIERKMPMEFSYMITAPHLVQPIVDEVRKKKGLLPVPVDVDLQEFIFFDSTTYLIDLNEARESPPRSRSTTKPFVLLTASVRPDQKVEIFRQGEFFVFQQMVKDQHFPFWSAFPTDESFPWFQMEFRGTGQTLRGFTFGVFGKEAGHTDRVDCQLQGSMDGKHWVDLGTVDVWSAKDDPHWRGYNIRAPAAYKKYRFYLIPSASEKAFQVMAIHMVLRFEV